MDEPGRDTPAGGGLARLRRGFGIRPGESGAVVAGFLFFFCLFASYFMLRPVRETMGIAGGVKNLQWLFTATFVVMLAAIPIYGAVCARLPRRRFVPWVYAFFIANLLAFAFATRVARRCLAGARVLRVAVGVQPVRGLGGMEPDG